MTTQADWKQEWPTYSGYWWEWSGRDVHMVLWPEYRLGHPNYTGKPIHFWHAPVDIPKPSKRVETDVLPPASPTFKA